MLIDHIDEALEAVLALDQPDPEIIVLRMTEQLAEHVEDLTVCDN